jgi:hypothetical protein
VIAVQVGMALVYHGVAVMLVIWAVAFGLLAQCSRPGYCPAERPRCDDRKRLTKPS